LVTDNGTESDFPEYNGAAAFHFFVGEVSGASHEFCRRMALNMNKLSVI